MVNRWMMPSGLHLRIETAEGYSQGFFYMAFEDVCQQTILHQTEGSPQKLPAATMKRALKLVE